MEFDNLWGKAHFGGKDYYGINNQIIYAMPFSEVKDGCDWWSTDATHD